MLVLPVVRHIEDILEEFIIFYEEDVESENEDSTEEAAN
jgi:hypothetical protein